MEKKDCVRIGKITKVHGLKGAVKVFPYADSLEIFETGSKFVTFGEANDATPLTVAWAKRGNRSLILYFSGIEDRDAAGALVGSELYIGKTSLPELEEGSYYWSDIIGNDVYTVDDEYIGRVVSIIPTAANDVYVVKKGDIETLVPALDWVVLSVDPDGKILRVDLPEGLR